MADPVAGPTTYPPGEWLRDLDFIDRSPDDATDAPVHATGLILANGKPFETPIHPDESILTGGSRLSGTVVSMVVLTADVKAPTAEDPDARIGTWRVLAPPYDQAAPDGGACAWETLPAEGDSEIRWTRVWFYARNVRWIARPPDCALCGARPGEDHNAVKHTEVRR